MWALLLSTRHTFPDCCHRWDPPSLMHSLWKHIQILTQVCKQSTVLTTGYWTEQCLYCWYMAMLELSLPLEILWWLKWWETHLKCQQRKRHIVVDVTLLKGLKYDNSLYANVFSPSDLSKASFNGRLLLSIIILYLFLNINIEPLVSKLSITDLVNHKCSPLKSVLNSIPTWK